MLAQSESCIPLGATEPHAKDGTAWVQGLTLGQPQTAYQSPLQRSQCEALRARRPLGATTLGVGVCTGEGPGSVPSLLPQPLRRSPAVLRGDECPLRGFVNYLYKLVPGGGGTLVRLLPLARGWDAGSAGLAGEDGAVESVGFRFSSLGLLSGFFSSNPRTRAPFKLQKSNRGTSSWQLKQYAEATLGSGSLRKAVKLPEGEDKDEWLAVNGEFIVRRLDGEKLG